MMSQVHIKLAFEVIKFKTFGGWPFGKKNWRQNWFQLKFISCGGHLVLGWNNWKEIGPEINYFEL